MGHLNIASKSRELEKDYAWLGLCDRITLKEKGKAAVRLRSGVEIEVEY